MKRHFGDRVAAKPLPALYDLPRDTKIAQQVAMGATMNVAFICALSKCTCKESGFPHHFTSPLHFFHITNTLLRIYANTPVDGRRGTNDEPHLRGIFLETIPRVYPAFLAFLQSAPHALSALSSLSERERLTTLNAAAVAQVSLLALPSDELLPLTWPAPELKKNEVSDGIR